MYGNATQGSLSDLELKPVENRELLPLPSGVTVVITLFLLHYTCVIKLIITFLAAISSSSFSLDFPPSEKP